MTATNHAFVPFVLPKNEYGYSEIAQSQPIKFAFVNETNDGKFVEIMLPAKCRDYFSDALHSTEFNQTPYKIYGFEWDNSTQSYEKSRTLLSVRLPVVPLEKFLANWDRIGVPVEKHNGFKPTIFHRPVDCGSQTFVVEADERWQDNSYLIGIYTLLFRFCCYEELNGDWDEEIKKKSPEKDGYFLSFDSFLPSLQKLAAIVEERRKTTVSRTGWGNDRVTGEVHDCSGVASMLTTPPINPLAELIQKQIAG
jgi:hypothetical protein